MTPKFTLFALQQIVFGGANCVTLKILNNAKSKLLIPCARSLASTRGSSPNVKSAGASKHAVLNHFGMWLLFASPSREVALPCTTGLHAGTTLGRGPPP